MLYVKRRIDTLISHRTTVSQQKLAKTQSESANNNKAAPNQLLAVSAEQQQFIESLQLSAVLKNESAQHCFIGLLNTFNAREIPPSL